MMAKSFTADEARTIGADYYTRLAKMEAGAETTDG
jgi:hypothetical protein